MQSHQLSSGDITVDRRADYARMLDEGGEPASAAELMEQALELMPRWAAGWFRLATYREKAGDGPAAADALRRVLALDPGDMFGACLKLAHLGAAAVPAMPPSRYVERLFDDYADRFETALVGKLGYSVPHKLATLIGTDRQFRLAVDLGCGTGLFGQKIRDRTLRLEGFDLSQNMLAKAAEKNLYDHLAQADLSLAPDVSGVLGTGLAAGRADLVSAADVLMYLGNLESVFAIVDVLAAPGACFAFSVEDAGVADGFHLAPSLRYVHAQHYIRRLCAAHGLAICDLQKTTIRKDGGKPVPGILFLTQKPL